MIGTRETMNSFDDDFEFNEEFDPAITNFTSTSCNSLVRSQSEEPVLVRLSDLAKFNISVNDIQSSGMVFNADDQRWEETEKCRGDVDLTGFESTCSNCSWDEEFGFTSAGDRTPGPLVVAGQQIDVAPSGGLRAVKIIEDDEISDLQDHRGDKSDGVFSKDLGESKCLVGTAESLHDFGDDFDDISVDRGVAGGDTRLPPSLSQTCPARIGHVLKNIPDMSVSVAAGGAGEGENYDDDFLLDDDSEDRSGTCQRSQSKPIQLKQTSFRADDGDMDISENDFDDDFTSGDMSLTLALPRVTTPGGGGGGIRPRATQRFLNFYEIFSRRKPPPLWQEVVSTSSCRWLMYVMYPVV